MLQTSLALAGLGLLAGCGILPSAPPAQAKVPRIGVLRYGSAASSQIQAFRTGLQELGYVEGQNIAVEYRHAGGDFDRLPELAAELVGLEVELIVAGPAAVARVVRDTAPRVPLVVAGGDPVNQGLLTNLARPEGNVTGVSTISGVLAAKWVELLKDAAPGISRVALLSDPSNPGTARHLTEAERAAVSLRVRLQSLSVRDVGELDGAFAAMRDEQAGGLVVYPGGIVPLHYPRIAVLAMAHRIPAIAESRGFVAAGGLLSYGANFNSLYRHAAVYVDKILKGAKPADLPVEQPTTFDFVVNLKTALALGLTIPQSVLQQATEVIQ